MSLVNQKKAFYKRLKLLGCRSYGDYLKSGHWKAKRHEWRMSKFPNFCIVCRSERYVLHHRSYTRLGDESLHDFIPLCVSCHEIVHNYINEHNMCVQQTHAAIRKIWGLTKGELKIMFEPLRKSKKKSTFTFSDGKRRDILKESKKAKRFK